MNRTLKLEEELKGVHSIGIAGHIRPDGDAVGSCLGLYLYLSENYPELAVQVYLEDFPKSFMMLKGTETISHEFHADAPHDLFIALDCADEKRLGKALPLLQNAKHTLCIDHHISNIGFADANDIRPDASSTSEIVADMLDESKISQEAAEALYMGIVHDTGVFRHSCTSPETLEVAAKLMRKGVRCNKIINDTYYDKTYYQNQILGRALLESVLLLDGKIIFSAVRQKELSFYGVGPSDLEGIVQQLMGTVGVETAIFLYETAPQQFKVSLRSREKVDVSEIASYFGGGGHVRAAGCTMQGSVYDVVNNITYHIEKQLCGEKQ